MTQTTTVPVMVNKTMMFLLRSPMHALVSKTVLLISFTGRKSGKMYTTPVSYSRLDDQVTIFTHAAWWKNLQSGSPSGAPVALRLQGQEVRGFAVPVAEDKQAIAAGLSAHLRNVPSDARWYGVRLDEAGNPNAEDVAKAVQTVVMIRILLC